MMLEMKMADHKESADACQASGLAWKVKSPTWAGRFWVGAHLGLWGVCYCSEGRDLDSFFMFFRLFFFFFLKKKESRKHRCLQCGFFDKEGGLSASWFLRKGYFDV